MTCALVYMSILSPALDCRQFVYHASVRCPVPRRRTAPATLPCLAGLKVGMPVDVPAGVRVMVGVGSGSGVCVGVGLAVAVCVGVTTGVAVCVGVGLTAGVCVGVTTGLGVSVAVGLGRGVFVGVTTGVGVCAGVGVTTGVDRTGVPLRLGSVLAGVKGAVWAIDVVQGFAPAVALAIGVAVGV